MSPSKNKNLFDWLGVLPIRSRIHLMTLIVVGAILLQESSHFIGGYTIGHYFARQAQFSKLSHLALEVEIGTLQMRRIEKNFRLKHHDQATGEHHDHFMEHYKTAASSVEMSLGQMARVAKDSSTTMRIGRLKAGINTQRQKFFKVHERHQVLGMDENSGLHGVLRKAVHAVEDKLNAANLDALTIKMLMMRRHEKDYMARGNTIYIDRLDKQRIEFNSLIKSAGLSDVTKAETLALMDAYQISFHAYVLTANKLNDDTKSLSRIYAGMLPDLQKLFQIAAAGEKQAVAQAAKVRDQVATLFLVIAALLLIASVSFAQIIGMSISIPVIRQTKAMKRLAEGDTSIDIPDVKDKNEIGDMARAVRVFKNNAIDRLRLQSENENEREARALRQIKTEGLITGFRNKVQAMLQSAVSNAGMMQGSAMSLAALATQTASQTNNGAMTSTQTSQSLEDAAAATAKLLSSTNVISKQITNNKAIVAKAEKAVAQTDQKITGLSASAEEIGDVLSLIQSIAEQTNVLALNATSEAARAGDAGKGFLDIASKVKVLAAETAEVTEMISRQITTIQSETELSANSLQGIIGIIREFASSTEMISAAFETQGLSATQISDTIGKISAGETTPALAGSSETRTTKENHKLALRIINFSHDVAAGNEELRGAVDDFLKKVAEA